MKTTLEILWRGTKFVLYYASVVLFWCLLLVPPLWPVFLFLFLLLLVLDWISEQREEIRLSKDSVEKEGLQSANIDYTLVDIEIENWQLRQNRLNS
ncbi:hypothetical protein [Rubripirellula reticaptiva]|uniref:Uncharacterized protein n=1 Tax=Rubripirellula reticaptiva TaxID=2528013 RepID=A0A5C6EI84_9BACT|nr:hypothetical protein [Rubripirellula reticaptiva]TWU49453.1 hypothetical protein Poly59_40680 [Rubripirellula reticaptiva]